MEKETFEKARFHIKHFCDENGNVLSDYDVEEIGNLDGISVPQSEIEATWNKIKRMVPPKLLAIALLIAFQRSYVRLPRNVATNKILILRFREIVERLEEAAYPAIIWEAIVYIITEVDELPPLYKTFIHVK